MATLIQTKTTSSIAAFFSAVAGHIGALFTSYAAANRYMARYNELGALSDKELAELGLSRDMLVHHVFGRLN